MEWKKFAVVLIGASGALLIDLIKPEHGPFLELEGDY